MINFVLAVQLSMISSVSTTKRNKVKMCLQGGPRTKKCHIGLLLKQPLATCVLILYLIIVRVTSRDRCINFYWC